MMFLGISRPKCKTIIFFGYGQHLIATSIIKVGHFDWRSTPTSIVAVQLYLLQRYPFKDTYKLYFREFEIIFDGGFFTL